MITTKNTESQKPSSQDTPPTTKESNLEMWNNSQELLQQAIDLLRPMFDFTQANEHMTRDDVRFYWDVKVIRGKKDYFAQVQGTSTLNGMLAPKMILDAPRTAEQEIINKIIMPLVGAFQVELNRVAFEELAAKEEEFSPM